MLPAWLLNIIASTSIVIYAICGLFIAYILKSIGMDIRTRVFFCIVCIIGGLFFGYLGFIEYIHGGVSLYEVIHLPEIRVAYIGILLIIFPFVLAVILVYNMLFKRFIHLKKIVIAYFIFVFTMIPILFLSGATVVIVTRAYLGFLGIIMLAYGLMIIRFASVVATIFPESIRGSVPIDAIKMEGVFLFILGLTIAMYLPEVFGFREIAFTIRNILWILLLASALGFAFTTVVSGRRILKKWREKTMIGEFEEVSVL